MKKLLYIWKEHTLWDVRFGKIFETLASSGYEVYLMARWKEGIEFPEQINNARVITVGYKKSSWQTEPISSNPVWRNAIIEAAGKIKPDIIMPREIMLAGAAWAAGKKYGIPVIMDMAENYPAAMKDWKKYRENFIRKILVHYLNIPERVEKNCIPKMDGIITVCLEQSERLMRQYGYPPEKTAIVHNTPVLNDFSGIRKGINGKAKVFGHHGNVTGDKRIDKFVTAFIEAAKVNPEIELHLYGPGEYFNDLSELINKSHCRDRIRITGRYDFADLPEIVGSFDIGILPYQVSDFNNTTLHNKVFDFFAAGKPVFLSETKPFRRLIDETNAGVIANCENSNSIKEAILNISSMDVRAMSDNAIHAAENKYNWETDGKNLLSFLEKYT